MDGLKRQERKHAEELEEEMALVSEQEQSNEAEAVIEEPKKENLNLYGYRE